MIEPQKLQMTVRLYFPSWTSVWDEPTSVAINIISQKLVPPHSNGDLLTSLTEGLDLAREGTVDVNMNALPVHFTNCLVEMGRYTGDKSHQVSKSQNQLITNLLGDDKQFRTLEEVGQGHRGAIEESEGDNEGLCIFPAELLRLVSIRSTGRLKPLETTNGDLLREACYSIRKRARQRGSYRLRRAR